jgi:hypothetical protein
VIVDPTESEADQWEDNGSRTSFVLRHSPLLAFHTPTSEKCGFAFDAEIERQLAASDKMACQSPPNVRSTRLSSHTVRGSEVNCQEHA